MTVPLLRIPPFPSATVPPLAQSTSSGGAALTDIEVDRLITAIADAKVGGAYWAAQSPIPTTPYTLVRIAEQNARAETIASLGHARPIVLWVEQATKSALEAAPNMHLIDGPIDPWHLLSGAAQVVVDADDELAFLAAIAGVQVTCVGRGRFEALGDGGAPAHRDALRRHAIDGLRYANPFTGQAMEIADAIALCGFWRKLIDSNRGITAAVGFASWKRPTVAPLLWAGTGPVRFVSKPGSMTADDQVAMWKSRTDPATIAELQASGARSIEVEDGFIRSTGLGADCVPPLSIIIDRLGIYFDPSRPSELELLLQEGEFDADMLDRARQLRQLIVETGVSKYGAGISPIERRADGKRHLLVPGQVEDDRSVISGGGDVSTNLELLRRVRDRNPDATILYKPHPDVQAGHRTGMIDDDLCLTLADEIVRTSSISSLIDSVDEVHVNTSLAGFETLLRGKPVTTYGIPFYAGWGLTRDLGAVPTRRSARRTLDELVAATLLLYPRYLDPNTGLPCPPEVLIRRLADGGVGRPGGLLVWLRRLQGRANRALSTIWPK